MDMSLRTIRQWRFVAYVHVGMMYVHTRIIIRMNLHTRIVWNNTHEPTYKNSME